jgi:hypothetical protein
MSIIWVDSNKYQEWTTNQTDNKLSRLFSGPLMDRTKSITSSYDFTVVNSIPEYKEVDSFEKNMESRASYLLSLKKPINIFWSGGIDSTAALIALLNAGAKKVNVCSALPDRLSLLSDKRITRIPISGLQYEHVIRDILSKKEILVTGELADQCMGSFSIIFYMQNKKIDILDISLVSNVISEIIHSPSDDIIDLVNPVIQKCPFKIKTVQDYFWWLNFTCKWQYVSMRILSSVDFSKEQFETNIQHFYNTNDFQCWAMNEQNHREQKHANGRYKDVMIRYIENSKYDNWLIDKEKIPSLNNYSFPKQTLYRLEDYSQMTMNVLDNKSVTMGKLNEVLIKK